MTQKNISMRGNKQLVLQVLTYIQKFPHATNKKILQHLHDTTPRELYDHLRHLERQRLVRKTDTTYTLTKRATLLLSEHKVWELTLPTTQKWDKRWHIVTFDIPKDKRRRRDAFRLRLKELGLVLYQNSIWLYPHPVAPVVARIAEFYQIEKFVSYILAEKISQEELYVRHFDLAPKK